MRKKRHKNKQSISFFARAARAGREDLSTRIPELSCLREKTVSVFGLGCLGAPSVLEFARCGVSEIRVVDFDIVEAGTIVRWPFGIATVGRFKTEVISEFINANYPYTNIVPETRKIGGLPSPEDEVSEIEILESVFDQSDLVFDATAERGVQHLISDLAAEKKIPYIGVSNTLGAWGGIIVRIRPQITSGCWLCFMHSLNEENFPSPSSDPAGEVQPVGCASPTFTGPSFDSGIIALSSVRLAVSTLTEKMTPRYPAIDWDVAVIDLRDHSGNAIAPSWNTFELKKHPSCSCATES